MQDADTLQASCGLRVEGEPLAEEQKGLLHITSGVTAQKTCSCENRMFPVPQRARDRIPVIADGTPESPWRGFSGKPHEGNFSEHFHGALLFKSTILPWDVEEKPFSRFYVLSKIRREASLEYRFDCGKNKKYNI